MRFFNTGLSILFCLLSTFVNAKTSQQEKFYLLLKKARNVSVPTGTVDEAVSAPTYFGFQKQSFAIQPVRIERDSAQDHIIYVEYNTETSPALKAAQLQSFALQFLRQQSEDFQVDVANLFPAAQWRVDLTDKVTSIHFGYRLQNIAIRDAKVSLTFFRDGENFFLRGITNHSFGNVQIENSNAPRAEFTNVKSALNFPVWELVSQRDVIIAKENPNQTKFVLASEFVVNTGDPEDQITLTVENGSDELLEAFSKKVYAAVRAKVYVNNYLDGNLAPMGLPLTSMKINNLSVTTDSDGGFSAALPVAAIIELASPRVMLVNSGTSSPYTINTNFNAEVTDLEQTGNGLRALNAYVAIHRINRFVRRHLKGNESPLLNRNIKVQMNVSGNCNAFYNGSISLYGEGGGCANMALVNDVIYHEWGHGLDDSLGTNPGIEDSAFSEGIGDILAAFYVNSPNMAAGFFLGKQEGIRSLDNHKKYPGDLTGEEHDDGLIIGGAFWHLREALIERHGAIKGAYIAENLFLRHLLTADSYKSSYSTLLSIDDDDGNPSTPSPNRCLINKVFAGHGLATAENCEDATEDRAVPLDEEIFLSVNTHNSDGSVILMAAAGDGEHLSLCEGDLGACASGRVDLDFVKEGEKDGKIFFVSNGSYTFKEHAIVTLTVKDKNNKPKGSRVLKIVSK